MSHPKKLLTFNDLPFNSPPFPAAREREALDATCDSFKEITKRRVSQRKFRLAEHLFIQSWLRANDKN